MTDYLHRKLPDLEARGVSSLFDEMSFWSAHFGDLFFRHYEFAPDLMVLDLGCGNGFPLFELAHSLGPSCRAVGLDTWKAALRRADFKRGLFALDRVSLVCGDGARLPFGGGTFDRVVSNVGINNFEDPPTVMAECFRILKSGGRLTMTTNVPGHMKELYDAFRELLTGRGDAPALERLEAAIVRRPSREKIGGMLEGAGFRVTRAVEDAFTMRYLDGTALLNHSLTRFGFLDGWRAIAGKDREDEIFASLEKRLNEAAGKDGLRMTVPMLYIEGTK